MEITTEQINEVREMLTRQRNRYQPKLKRRYGSNYLSDEFIIHYISNYINSKQIKKSKYCNLPQSENQEIKQDNKIFKIYKKFNDVEFNDRMKQEINTGYVSFF